MAKRSTKKIKSKIKKEAKKNKGFRKFLFFILVICIIGVSGYIVYDLYFKKEPQIELPKELGEANETLYVSWNKEFNLTKDSVFYQYNRNEINTYYKDVNFKSDKEELRISLFETLKDGHKKLVYEGNNKDFGMNILRANYCLADRNWNVSSPLENEIKTNTWQTDGVTLDILYQKDDLVFNKDLGPTGFLDREHIYAKSYGFNMENNGYKDIVAGCDLHNLYSANHPGNSNGHNNRLYNEVSDLKDKKEVLSKDGKTVSYYTNEYYEPPLEDRGNIARAIFYMSSRYYEYYTDELGESPRLVIGDDAKYIGKTTYNPIDTKNGTIKYGILSTLLKWNMQDPVDENEMVRNNSVYHLQGNRNPFIDFPNLANIIFAV